MKASKKNKFPKEELTQVFQASNDEMKHKEERWLTVVRNPGSPKSKQREARDNQLRCTMA